jgi:putative membrane protein
VRPKGLIAMMWGYGWGWGYWLGMGVTMVLFWGLVIIGIVALVRYIGSTWDTGRPPRETGPARPEEVLAQRYARGEIDDDEYMRRRELLWPSG